MWPVKSTKVEQREAYSGIVGVITMVGGALGQPSIPILFKVISGIIQPKSCYKLEFGQKKQK